MILYLSTIERWLGFPPDLLDERRFQQYSKARSDHRRAELLAGTGLLRRALAEFGYAANDQPLPIRYTEEGKPYLENGPYFSISHSGNLAVCAVSDENIGVDIERVSRFKNARVARKVLIETENECFRKLSGASAARYLADRWTAKEAISKLIGKGIAVPFTELRPEEYRSVLWEYNDDGEVYYIRTAAMR